MLSLGEAGYREVTLLGQNVDAYGRDLPGFAPDNSGRRAWTFTDLLRYVHDVPGGWVGGWAGWLVGGVRGLMELPFLCSFLAVGRFLCLAGVTHHSHTRTCLS